MLNYTIKGKQVIVFCGEKWSAKEQRQFEQQLDKIGKSVVLIHNVFTNDLANSTLIPIENKADYSVILILDDLQDIIEKIDSGIVSVLQDWRHRNVVIVCLNQTR